jgi:aminoglycoside phosphotransferase (APT) family kinase protein
LLESQCPEFAREPIVLVDEGWDNFTFRIGERQAARLPRRELGVALLAHEQCWLPLLAERLTLEVPVPVHVGRPDAAFPWPWSVVHWIEGTTCEAHSFSSSDVSLLAENLRELHRPAPADAPENPYRGVPLANFHRFVVEQLQRLNEREVNVLRLRELWQQACALPAPDQRVWIHGDVHPRNVVVRQGTLVGLIDWGDLCGGDPATDLAGCWMLIDLRDGRAEFWQAYCADEQLISRARGWAIRLALAHYASGEPRHVPIGLAALRRVLADSEAR